MLYYNNNKFALSSSIIFSLSISSVLQLLSGHFKQILILNTFIFMFLVLFYATENNLKLSELRLSKKTIWHSLKNFVA